jgi:hypothetical protein
MVEITVSVLVSITDTEPLPSLVAYARDWAKATEAVALKQMATQIEKCNFFITNILWSKPQLSSQHLRAGNQP